MNKFSEIENYFWIVNIIRSNKTQKTYPSSLTWTETLLWHWLAVRFVWAPEHCDGGGRQQVPAERDPQPHALERPGARGGLGGHVVDAFGRPGAPPYGANEWVALGKGMQAYEEIFAN